MGSKKPVTGIRDLGEELGTAHRIVTGALGDHRAKRIGLQLELLGIAARANRCTQIGCRPDRIAGRTRSFGSFCLFSGAVSKIDAYRE